MRRIAFCGGTFDPPHRGHLAIARAAADRYALDLVLFAPVGLQPLKTAAAQASFIDRYAMVALATQHEPRFLPSLVDAPRTVDGVPQPNYTVDTLARLRAWFSTQEAKVHLYALIGADSWRSIVMWREPEKLLAQANWIIAARPGFSLKDVPSALPERLRDRCVFHESSGEYLLQCGDERSVRISAMADLNEEISATGVRAALARGHTVGDLVSDAVADYIHKRRLYVDGK